MSFLFILIQPHANPAGSVVLSEQLRDLPEVIHLIHVRAEIQLWLSILPGSLVSPQETLLCDAFHFVRYLSLAISCSPSQAPAPICPKEGTCLRTYH